MLHARVCAPLLVLAAFAAGAVTPAVATLPFAQVSLGMASLTIPQGPRNFAMGQTGVADDASPANVFYNPANIAFYDRVYRNANYVDWPFDLYLFDVGVFGGYASELSGDRALYVAAAARYFRMNADSDWERTIFLPDGSSKEFELADRAIPLSLAAGLSTRHVDIGIGSTVKFAYTTFGDETLDATAVDLGAFARKTITPWEAVTGASVCRHDSGRSPSPPITPRHPRRGTSGTRSRRVSGCPGRIGTEFAGDRGKGSIRSWTKEVGV